MLKIRLYAPARGLAILALGALAGCSLWNGAPVPKTVPSARVTAPEPPELEKTKIMGMAKTGDVNTVIDRFANWGGIFDPEITAEKIRDFWKQSDIDLSNFQSGKNIAAWTPDEPVSMFSMPWCALLPLKSWSGAFASHIDGLGVAHSPAAEGYTLLADKKPTLGAAQQKLDAILPLITARPSEDVALSLNLAALHRLYGGLIAQQFKAQTTQFAENAQMPPAQAELIKNEMAMLIDVLEQSQTATFGVAAPPQKLELRAGLAFKPQSRLGKNITASTRDWPDLAQLLEPGVLRFQCNIDNPRGWADTKRYALEKIYANAPKPALDRAMECYNSLAQSGSLAIAESIHLKQNKLCVDAVMLPERPRMTEKKILEALAPDSIAAWNEVLKQAGNSFALKELPARRLRGFKVHAYELSFSFGKAMPPEAEKLIKGWLGENGRIHFEFARMGKLILFTLNQPVEKLADRVYSQPSLPLQASKSLPGGGTVYGDFDARELWGFAKDFSKSMTAQMPAKERAELPSLPADLPLLSFAAWSGPARAQATLLIPREFVTKLAAMGPAAK